MPAHSSHLLDPRALALEDSASWPLVLLTGATTGLGLAIAQQLARLPYRLLLTGREPSLSRLAQVGLEANDRITMTRLDVTSQTEREAAIELAGALGGVDVLINNAGFAYRAVVEHFTEEAELGEMDVNFRGPIELIRLALPGMRRKRAGRILNVSSVAGMMAMPTMALYSASKFALEGATEALWYEVRPWNIRVSLIQPGFIRSTSFQNTRYTPISRSAASDETHPYHCHYRHMERFIAGLMARTMATPEKVATQVVRAMRLRHPPLRIPATPDAHLFALLRRFLPRPLYHQILYWGLPRIRDWGKTPDRLIEPK